MTTTDAEATPAERRQQPQPTTPDELLAQLPARVILDRTTTPVIGIANAGSIAYANTAFASMLGYVDVSALRAQPLYSLLVGHSLVSSQDCLNTLRHGSNRVVGWSHAEGFPVHTLVSKPLLLRAADPLLVFNVSDITELLWAQRSPLRRD